MTWNSFHRNHLHFSWSINSMCETLTVLSPIYKSAIDLWLICNVCHWNMFVYGFAIFFVCCLCWYLRDHSNHMMCCHTSGHAIIVSSHDIQMPQTHRNQSRCQPGKMLSPDWHRGQNAIQVSGLYWVDMLVLMKILTLIMAGEVVWEITEPSVQECLNELIFLGHPLWPGWWGISWDTTFIYHQPANNPLPAFLTKHFT